MVLKIYNSTNDEIANLADSYTLFYGFIGQRFIDSYGKDGDSMLREATRRFGRDRGEFRRSRQLAENYKINMQNLFSIGSDLPADDRFFGYLVELSPERRMYYNLRCPMAEIWAKYDMNYVGRLYCEEFHPACYESYAYDYTDVNLSSTLTQEGDGYCSFNIVLRPENIPNDIRSQFFEQCDLNYSGSTAEIPRISAKEGYRFLCIKLTYYFIEVLTEELGKVESTKFMTDTLTDYLDFAIKTVKGQAQKDGKAFTEEYFSRNYPLSLSNNNDYLWDEYNSNEAQDLITNVLMRPLKDKIHTKKQCYNSFCLPNSSEVEGQK